MRKKAGKLAYICKCSTNDMLECVKKHPEMSFRELLKMICHERKIDLEGEHHSEYSDSDKEEKHKGDKMWGESMWGGESRKRKESDKPHPIETPKGENPKGDNHNGNSKVEPPKK